MPRVDDAGDALGTDARRGWTVAVAATLGMTVSYVDRQTVAAIGSAVREGLHIDHAQFGWLVGAFSMAYLVFAPLAGRGVDQIGARKGFALAVVAWTAVAAGHAFATSFAMLFTLRILLGMTEAPSFPAAAQAIRRAMPGARKSAAYGLLFTGSSIGAMVAAPVALHLEGRYGFRAAFVGTAVLGTAWLPFWLWTTRGGRLAGGAPGPVAAAPRGAALGEILAVAKSPPVLRSVVAVLGSAPVLMFVLNWTPQYLVEVWKLPRSGIAHFLVFPPLLFDVGAVGFGFLASARVPRGRARTHTDLLFVAMLLAALLLGVPFATSAPVAVALLSLAAAGGGGLYVLVTADTLGRVPLARTSTAGGITAAAQSLAHIVAAPLAGSAIDRTHGYDAALLGLGAVVVPAVLAFAFWPVEPASPART